jgi:hypothetical protein
VGDDQFAVSGAGGFRGGGLLGQGSVTLRRRAHIGYDYLERTRRRHGQHRAG